MTSRRYATPSDFHPALTASLLRKLAVGLKRRYDRAFRRLRPSLPRPREGRISAVFNFLDTARYFLKELESEGVTYVTEYGWAAYHVSVGDGREMPPVPLRWGAHDKRIPQIHPQEERALAALYEDPQLDLFRRTPPLGERIVVRMILEHNMAGVERKRRATRVILKFLNRDFTRCYQEWVIWESRAAKQTRTPAVTPVEIPGSPAESPANAPTFTLAPAASGTVSLTPPDEVKAADFELLVHHTQADEDTGK